MNKRLRGRAALVGRIRVGDRGGRNGAPRRLETFRLTVPNANKLILDACAQTYGGTVEAWQNPATQTREWALQTEQAELGVYILPAQCVFASCELWSAAGLLRRCDGETIEIDNEHPNREGGACVCPSDTEERLTLGKAGKACVDKTRISVMLPQIPGFGYWRLDTGSYFAATEALGVIEHLQLLGITEPVEALLTLEEAVSKRLDRATGKPVTRRFARPALKILATPQQVIMAGREQRLLGQGQTIGETIDEVWGDRPGQRALQEGFDGSQSLVDTATGEVLHEAEGGDAAAPASPAGEDDPAFEEWVTQVQHHWRNYFDLPWEVLRDHVCMKHNVSDLHELSEGQRKKVLTWVGDENGRAYLTKALAKEGA